MQTFIRVASVSSLLVLIAAAPVRAGAFNDHDNAPLTGIFGLPDSSEGALLAERGSTSWSVVATTSSHALSESSGSERLVFDGETTRIEARLRYGIGERAEIGVELPYLWQHSGGLDSLIDGWHDLFGLPDGARDELPRDVLRYFLADGNDTLLDVDQNSSGVGDVRLFGGYRLSDRSRHRTAIRLGVKFATGSADELHGSGGTDFSVGYAGDLSTLRGSERWSAFYRLHVVHIGEPDWLSDRYEEWVGLLTGGLRYDVNNRVSLGVQAGFRTALYDLQSDELGTPAVTLTFGGEIALSERMSLAIAVGEDVKVGSSPDVTFQLGLRYQPR